MSQHNLLCSHDHMITLLRSTKTSTSSYRDRVEHKVSSVVRPVHQVTGREDGAVERHCGRDSRTECTVDTF